MAKKKVILPSKNMKRVIIGSLLVLLGLLLVSRNLSITIWIFVTLVGLLLFYLTDHFYKQNFPEKYYFFIFWIFVSGFILGPNEPPFGFYYRNIYFDKILHYANPIFVSAIVFFMINRLQLTLKWKFLVTTAIVMGILGAFEIGEYVLDLTLGFRHQGVYLADYAREIVHYESILSPIDDNMQDLIFGLFGALTFVTFKMVEVKFKNK